MQQDHQHEDCYHNGDEDYLKVIAYSSAKMSRAQLQLRDGEELQTKRQDKKLAIRCGRLIDGYNVWKDPKESSTTKRCVIVLVTGCLITKVGWEGEVEIPADAKVLDYSNYTVLPGLIDCHIHPFNLSENYQVAHLKQSSAYKALKGLRVLQDLLQCGWTTVRIAGECDVYFAQFDIRTVIQQGLFVGPRICGAGHYLSITGGGGDINDLAPEQCGCVPDGRIVNGAEEMRKAVREEIKFGSDWIKLLVTGAYMTAKDNPLNVHFTQEELETAVVEAERFGKHVMAHAHSADGIRHAVRAGVRSIEHGSFIDDECVKLMKEKGTYLVPTQYIGEYFNKTASPTGPLGKMLAMQKNTDPVSKARLKRAVASGVNVALGTDGPGWPVEDSVLEMKCLLELGMSELEVIRAATSSAAALLGWEDKVGSIQEGKLADIIAVEGDPLSDITCMQKVQAVILGGEVVKKAKRFF